MNSWLLLIRFVRRLRLFYCFDFISVEFVSFINTGSGQWVMLWLVWSFQCWPNIVRSLRQFNAIHDHLQRSILFFFPGTHQSHQSQVHYIMIFVLGFISMNFPIFHDFDITSLDFVWIFDCFSCHEAKVKHSIERQDVSWILVWIFLSVPLIWSHFQFARNSNWFFNENDAQLLKIQPFYRFFFSIFDRLSSNLKLKLCWLTADEFYFFLQQIILVAYNMLLKDIWVLFSVFPFVWICFAWNHEDEWHGSAKQIKAKQSKTKQKKKIKWRREMQFNRESE